MGTPATRRASGIGNNSDLWYGFRGRPKSSDNLPDYYVIVAMLFVTLLVLTLVIRSRLGLAFRVIGQNVQAARASGINSTRFLVINFTLSCALAGLVGGFYAHYYGILTPDVTRSGSAWTSSGSGSPTCPGSTSSCTESCLSLS